jgi:predicted GNAT family N-acyltransferase
MIHQDAVAFGDGTSPRSPSARVAFSAEFDRIVARSNIASSEIAHATIEEVKGALALARKLFPVVDEAVAAAVFTHNPDCFRIVRRESLADSAMAAYLPLNDAGAAALVDGRFDGLKPQLRHICSPGERPSAIYSWLTYTPGKMVSGLRLLQELERYGEGSPIFTRPAHADSARILAMAGFVPARSLFPSAPYWLIVARSERRALARTLQVRIARSFEDVAKVMMVRSQTYLEEQLCTFAEEFDGNDFCATHLLGEADGEPAGCLRIRYFADFAKLERLAVRPAYRGTRLMWRLVRAAFEHCGRKGYRKLYAHAREDLVPAWERFGARLMENRPPFTFSDVRFREMELELPARTDSLGLGSDPMMLIRPEGEWDRLGPIDRAQLRIVPGRAAHLRDLRTLNV